MAKKVPCEESNTGIIISRGWPDLLSPSSCVLRARITAAHLHAQFMKHRASNPGPSAHQENTLPTEPHAQPCDDGAGMKPKASGDIRLTPSNSCFVSCVCVCVCVCVHVCLCSSSPPLPRCIYNSFHAGVDHPGNGRLKFNINDPTFASCFATRYGAAEVAQ